MTKEAAIKYALSLFGTSSDMPFKEDYETTVLRHTQSRKWFGIIMKHGGYIINLKCDPDYSDFMKRQYKGIKEAYHMNKRLWITVELASDVPDEEIKRLIEHSYTLTSKKAKKRKSSEN